MKIFALTSDRKVLRLKMQDLNLESETVAIFQQCYKDYEKPENIIKFSASNRNGASKDDIFLIDNYIYSNSFHEATRSTSACGVYDPSTTSLQSIVALFVKPNDSEDKLLFQYFDNPKKLSNERFVIFSKTIYSNEFLKLEGAGFVLDSKLVAVLDGSNLYFKSFFFAKRVFALGDYFREATDQELVNFNHHPTFNPIEDDKLKAIANQNMREKVFEIEKSGVLNSLDIKKFVTYAQLADLDVTVKDGRINIPKNKDSLKRFLSLLCEDYYYGNLQNRIYLSTGKRSAK